MSDSAYENLNAQADRMKSLENELAALKSELAFKTREIEVEKALEKIRIKALDMRQSAELSETSALLFQQLKELNIEAIRTGVGIFDDEANAIELWITSVTQDGRLVFILDYVNVHVHPVFENVVECRNADKPFALTKLEGKDLFDYYTKMATYTGIPDRRNMLPCEYFYSFFFSAGTINVVSNKELNEEEIDIMLRLANVFGLIYTRFRDLKKSEDQAVLIREEKTTLEIALNNLKATQTQLIQAEKMASLGELTAGIAHEIQNPLNFVNNFSELNKELLAELEQAESSGNARKVKSIAKNIRSNEEKIFFHGKRAEAIVKNMLQHARKSTGQKEPIDINLLCDEYLRLVYHGVRGKEKHFNVDVRTDYDQAIGKISVVPQEIGRVFVNLFSNAFYATSLKHKTGDNAYKPVVIVQTKKLADTIEIRVADNGNGIPETIIDKIFQPFFTTKPTGEGTGLGLSLSYDIVKAHGGEIKAESREGDGTEFIVTLPLA